MDSLGSLGVPRILFIIFYISSYTQLLQTWFTTRKFWNVPNSLQMNEVADKWNHLQYLLLVKNGIHHYTPEAKRHSKHRTTKKKSNVKKVKTTGPHDIIVRQAEGWNSGKHHRKFTNCNFQCSMLIRSITMRRLVFSREAKVDFFGHHLNKLNFARNDSKVMPVRKILASPRAVFKLTSKLSQLRAENLIRNETYFRFFLPYQNVAFSLLFQWIQFPKHLWRTSYYTRGGKSMIELITRMENSRAKNSIFENKFSQGVFFFRITLKTFWDFLEEISRIIAITIDEIKTNLMHSSFLCTPLFSSQVGENREECNFARTSP